MVFDSYLFFAFLGVVLLLYYKLPHKGQNGLLLIGSYTFYGCWDWRFLSLIFFSTVVDFLAGKIIHTSRIASNRKVWLGISCVVNLGLLGFFKYFNFFVSECNTFMESVGMEGHLTSLTIILPVGISFYTFQTMSYTIDIYRRITTPIDRFSDFALYVSFFPQLVAGPIERSKHLIPQVITPRTITATHVSEGTYMILWGLVKKVVIADNAAIIADLAFESPLEHMTAVECLVGVYAFAFQIYGDFSGYSLIARGTARLLGFDLMQNFNFPYFATAPRFIWHRWHISLSSWLRDYLYISLGGSRKGKARNYANLMITMLLGGLWHGAAWRFVVWGAFHGGLLAIDRKLFSDRLKDNARVPLGMLGAFLTFHLMCISWIFFRGNSLNHAFSYLKVIVTGWRGFGELGIAMSLFSLIFLVPIIAYEAIMYYRDDHFWLLKRPWPIRALGYTIFLLLLIFMGAPSRHEFIYFQF